MNTKKILILFIFVMSIFAIRNTSLCSEDVSAPTIKPDTIKISNTSATIGDTINIAMEVNDETRVQCVGIYYTKPQTCASTNAIYLEYNSSTNLYEATITIDNNWQNGIYKIEHIYVTDGNNSDIYYNNKNSHSLGYKNNIDLSKGDFTIYGTTADATPPVINPSTLKVSKQQVITDDIVEFSIKITDNIGIKNASIHLENEDIKNWRVVNLQYDKITGLYKGSLIIDSYMQEGPWYIKSVLATDTNSNQTSLYNSRYSNEYGWNKLTIYNYKTYTTPVLTQNSLSVDKSKVTNGDTINISLEAMDKFGIESVKIYYNQEKSREQQLIELPFNKTIGTSSTAYYTYYYNQYLASINFNKYGYNGIWKIDKIEIISIKGVLNTIYNKEFSDDENAIDLSAGNFETYGLIDDNEKPTVNTYSISKNIIDYKEEIKLYIDAKDEKSGIKNVLVNYTFQNGLKKDYYLNLENGKYVYIFKYDDLSKMGDYIINYILVEDNAGNFKKITENISNLNFKFRTAIKIISPSLYLDTYSTYNLQCLVDYKYKDIRCCMEYIK